MKDIMKSIVVYTVSGIAVSLAVSEIHAWRQRQKKY